MTELYVTARINDSETGEFIEKVDFIYCVEQTVEELDDLSLAQIEGIEEEIEERREYERADGDLYCVDLVVLEDEEDAGDDGEEEE